MERLKRNKAPIIRDLIEEIELGELPNPIYDKIIQDINFSIIRECESMNILPNMLQLNIFGRDFIIYQRSDNKLEMIEKKFYEILKCKQII